MRVGFARLLLLSALWPLVGLAQAGQLICGNAPRSHWISWQEIETRLSEQGQRLVRLRITGDRCLTVLALDARGGYSEMRMDPVSGKILSTIENSEPHLTGSLPKPAKN